MKPRLLLCNCLALCWAVPLLLGGPAAAQTVAIPADAESALDALNSSPRHGEWIDIGEGRSGANRWGDTIRSWIVYPERATRAPVVVVIHEIFGLTDWIRAVADQFAAEGFIAIAPDLLSGHGADGGGTPANRQEAVALVRSLRVEDTTRRLSAVARYGISLPASNGRFGGVGFCWGGSTSFNFAANEENLDAAVVYYGSSPSRTMLGRVEAPVLGLYGGDDARVNATIPDAMREMRRLGKFYEPHQFDGAGHGFLRQQSARDGANLSAAKAAWAKTVEFFRQHLEK
ncbi:MAG: dienelactone hydrolase family protein [Bryobacterales bacterium]|nr:dienelactone hydrolase family protein [Bryobacterales bacterium]MDE0623106.1 dienelactone hydrolase family protein [Bryobacterales bacterium]